MDLVQGDVPGRAEGGDGGEEGQLPLAPAQHRGHQGGDLPGDGTIRDPIQQAGRLRVARAAADAFGVSLFINARTDLFLRSKAEAHAGLVDDALERARLYADAGADSLFVPGLADPGLIARVAAESPLPVNVMVGAGPVDKAALARAGVARISYGPAPWLMAMQALEDLARAAL
ncbi:MAG TPA: isocitrate lyase/phosphoenolpyruvate mutase family protein [Arenimonas sp.]|nr:isocitrate lyase/phosphoenolpyruvate mutase family protein [Arenimonas sp.]